MEKPKMPKLQPLPIKKRGLRQWKLLENWSILYKSYETITIPEGFIFDGASIPWFFRRWYNPTGYLFLPALVHDYMYKHGYYIFVHEQRIFKTHVTRQIADFIFYRLSEKYYPKQRFKTALAYKAITLFGWNIWEEYKENHIN